MTSIFAYVRPLMDMRFEKGLGPSFLKLYDNVAFVLLLKDTHYTFLWTNGYPNLHKRDQRSRLIRDAVHKENVN